MTIRDQALLGAAGAGGATDWTEEFPFDSDSGWTIAAGGGGTMSISGGNMNWNSVDQNFSGYATKQFSSSAFQIHIGQCWQIKLYGLKSQVLQLLCFMVLLIKIMTWLRGVRVLLHFWEA